MNAKQQKYLVDRINDISREKSYKIVKKCFLVDSEKFIEDVKKGLIKPIVNQIDKYKDLYLVFNYDEVYKEEMDAFEKEQNEKLKRLKEHTQRCIDEVMLGDSENAFNILKSFEEFGE